MFWDTAGGVAIAVLGVSAAALQFSRRGESARAAIRSDVEILGLLPPGSEAHRELARHVQARVVRLVRFEEGARRDPSGIAVVGVCLASGGLCTFLAIRDSGFRWFGLSISLFFLALAVWGAVLSIPRTQRDAKGKPVGEPAGQGASSASSQANAATGGSVPARASDGGVPATTRSPTARRSAADPSDT
jgi:hypothetical protein